MCFKIFDHLNLGALSNQKIHTHVDRGNDQKDVYVRSPTHRDDPRNSLISDSMFFISRVH